MKGQRTAIFRKKLQNLNEMIKDSALQDRYKKVDREAGKTKSKLLKSLGSSYLKFTPYRNTVCIEDF